MELITITLEIHLCICYSPRFVGGGVHIEIILAEYVMETSHLVSTIYSLAVFIGCMHCLVSTDHGSFVRVTWKL